MYIELENVNSMFVNILVNVVLDMCLLELGCNNKVEQMICLCGKHNLKSGIVCVF
jgi:hypothetical protein